MNDIPTVPRDQPIPDIWGARTHAKELSALCGNPRYEQWYRSLISRCDELAPVDEDDLDTGADNGVRRIADDASTLAWGWLLSGTVAYEQAARMRLEVVAWATEAWSSKYHTDMYPDDRADLGVSETIKASATALSILDPILEPGERGRLAERCCVSPGSIIYEDMMKGCWWGDALNSNWTSVLNSALGFAGIVGIDQPGIETGHWIEAAGSHITSMLDLAAADAGGVEGPSYWIYCFGSAQDFAVALAALGDERMLHHRFWERAATYLQYFVLPDYSGWINYGDTPYDSIAGSHVFHGISCFCDEPRARRRAKVFADAMLTHHPGFTWKNLLYETVAASRREGDTSARENETTDTLPRSAFFESVHLASFRSGWGDDDTLLFVRGGSNAWSHMHLDLGSFVIHAMGERLAVDPGPAPYSVHYWHSIVDEVTTRWHNCMVIDGANQRVGAQYAMTNDLEEPGDCYARMYGRVTGESIDIISLDCSAAYGDYLSSYTRTFAFLAPSTILVFDDCMTHPVRAQRNFEWLIHSECPMIDTGNSIVARGKRAELVIRPLIPENGEHKLVEGKTLPKIHTPLHCASFRPYWHHKWNVDPTKSAYPHWLADGDVVPLYGNSYRFVHSLEINPTETDHTCPVRMLANESPYVCATERDDTRSLVAFDPDRTGIDAGGLRTDGSAAIVRSAGSRIEWCVVDGSYLELDGNMLFRGQCRSDKTGVTTADSQSAAE